MPQMQHCAQQSWIHKSQNGPNNYKKCFLIDGFLIIIQLIIIDILLIVFY